jgi:SAM-dependent methyltransferase
MECGMSIDELYLKIRECVKFGDMDNAKILLDELRTRIDGEIAGSSRWRLIQIIERINKGNKDAFVLDYGCGAGHTLVFLYLLGYVNVFGVDFVSKEKNLPDSNLTIQDHNNLIMELFGIKNIRFHQYDGHKLPFADNTFDVVFSEQVLEHVHNIEQYYKESCRVMNTDSFAYFTFPHKFCPYDSHGQTWFVHMLPERMVLFCYKILGRNVKYLTELLNFKTMAYHRTIAAKYFSDVSDITPDILKLYTMEDLSRFKGNKTIRKAIDFIIRQKLIGPFATGFFSIFAMANIVVSKGSTVTLRFSSKNRAQ